MQVVTKNDVVTEGVPGNFPHFPVTGMSDYNSDLEDGPETLRFEASSSLHKKATMAERNCAAVAWPWLSVFESR